MAENGDTNPKDVDPGERGTLTVRERAVQHTALAAVHAVHGVSRDNATLRQLTGRTLPSADVDVAGDCVLVRVDVAADWGVPLHRIVSDVRASVTDALREHAGMSVDGVRVHVASITASAAHTERRGS